MKHTVPVNPKLPPRFDDTPNQDRPPSHMLWWNRPYIQTFTWEEMRPLGQSGLCPRTPASIEADRIEWFKAWPSGTRYDVRCLDGGAWDRPTWWGSFATIDEAIACASQSPEWRLRSKLKRSP